MKIPTKFKCAGFDIKIQSLEKLDGNDFGLYNDVTNIIKLAENISINTGELTKLTERQRINTFWHEVGHVFQFHSGKEFNEEDAQIFANFMTEFFETYEQDCQNS